MTDVTLKEYIESQIQWLDRHVKSQIEQIDVSTVKALAQLDKRLEGMNEFRTSLQDAEAARQREATKFITRPESEMRHEAIEGRLKSMELSRAAGEGRLLLISGFVAFVASILVAVIARWLVR
jgi:hypothetical protein